VETGDISGAGFATAGASIRRFPVKPDGSGTHPVKPTGSGARQLAIAELEDSVLAASAQAKNATIDDLGSAAFMVDLASMAHETQYTRLFRS
jgi:hypothetical protein